MPTTNKQYDSGWLDLEWEVPLGLPQIRQSVQFEALMHQCRLATERMLSPSKYLHSYADDIFQETYIHIFQKTKAVCSFQTPRHFRRYFLTTAKRRSLDFLKTEKRRASRHQRLRPTEANFESHVDLEEFRDLVKHLIQRIKSEMIEGIAAVMIIRIYDGLRDCIHYTENEYTTWHAKISRNLDTRKTHARRGKQQIYSWINNGQFSDQLSRYLRLLFDNN